MVSTREQQREQQQRQQQQRQQDDAIMDDNNTRCKSFGSDLGATANLCSATLGAGILALPFGMCQSGLVYGGILLVLSAIATIVSIDLLTDATREYRCESYEDLVELALGKRSRTLTELSIVLSCEGVLVAYLIAVGDILEPFVGKEWRAASMIVAWAFTMMPLSLLRTMESLQWASSTGMISIGLLVVAAMHHVVEDDVSDEAYNLAPLLWPVHGATSVLIACPIFLFAFSCQVNVSSIYNELPRKASMRCVTRTSVTFCALLYVAMGVIGLWDFGDDVEPNILMNYHNPKSPYIAAAYISMVVALVVAFPLNVFPARTTMLGFLQNASLEQDSTTTEEDVEEDDDGNDLEQPLLDESHDSMQIINSESPSETTRCEASGCAHAWTSICVAGSSLGLALVVPNISVVFGLLGGTMGSLTGFLLPGALGVVIGQKWAGWILIVSGALIGVVTTAVTVYSLYA